MYPMTDFDRFEEEDDEQFVIEAELRNERGH